MTREQQEYVDTFRAEAEKLAIEDDIPGRQEFARFCVTLGDVDLYKVATLWSTMVAVGYTHAESALMVQDAYRAAFPERNERQ